MMENRQHQIFELKIALLAFMSHELLGEELDKAYRIFSLGMEEPSPQKDRGFNEWLIHDYLVRDKDAIIDIYGANHPVDPEVAATFKGSVFSCFKTVKTGDRVYFKDIFTKEDYLLDSESLVDDEGVILARIYPCQNRYFFLDDVSTFHRDFEPHLLKGIMEKFSEARELLGYLDISEFLRRNTFLLYAYANMVDEVMDQSLEEVEYTVHESLYQVLDQARVAEVLNHHGEIRIILRSEGIYQLILDDLVIGEIIDLKERLEMNCNSEALMDQGKQWIEAHLKEAVIHLKDSRLDLEDVLEN